MFFSMQDIPVVCSDKEYTRFPPPAGQTCGGQFFLPSLLWIFLLILDMRLSPPAYLQNFLSTATAGYVRDPESTTLCEVCQYSSGNEYLAGINLGNRTDGARNSLFLPRSSSGHASDLLSVAVPVTSRHHSSLHRGLPGILCFLHVHPVEEGQSLRTSATTRLYLPHPTRTLLSL